MPNELNVTSKTTLAQLDTFARSVDDQSRLRGRRNDDGSITLYVKPGSPGLFSKISPGAIAHRAAAREAVRMVFDNVDRTGRGAYAVSQDVRTALDTGMRNDMKGASLKLLVEAGQPGKARERGPGLDDCLMMRSRMAGFGQRLDDIVARGGDQTGALDALAREMGDAIAQGYLAGHKGDGDGLALSTGVGMKHDLREALSEHVDLSKLDDGFLDQVFEHAAQQVLPNHFEDDGNTLILNGKTYRPDRMLGSGAYGVVQLYVSDEGPPIALKMAKTDGLDPVTHRDQIEKLQGDLIKEVHSHRRALDEGHPGIVKLEGIVRVPGGVAVALECMPKGTLDEAMTRLSEQVKAGNVSPTAARAIAMTLVHDTMEGLRQTQSQGISHFDFKSPNVMIDGQGHAKITDFGLAMDLEEFDFTNYDRPDNPLWLAPETLKDSDRMSEVSKKYVQGSKDPKLTGPTAVLHDRFKNITGAGERNALLGHVTDARKQGDFDTIDFQTSGKSDVWSLGVTAFNLVFGRHIDSNRFLSGVGETLVEFGSREGNLAIDTSKTDTGAKWLETEGTRRGPPPPDKPDAKGPITGISYAGSSGSKEVDDLLNQLMAPKPEQRPDLDDLVDHPAFQVKGAGTTEVRELIKALFGGTPDVGKVRMLSSRVDRL